MKKTLMEMKLKMKIKAKQKIILSKIRLRSMKLLNLLWLNMVMMVAPSRMIVMRIVLINEQSNLMISKQL